MAIPLASPPRERPSVKVSGVANRQFTWSTAAPILAFLAMAAAAVLLTLVFDGGLYFWGLYGITALVLTVAFSRISKNEAPFAPYGFPLIYTTIGITVSTVVAINVGYATGFLSADLITNRVILVETLFIAGLFIGTMFTRDVTYVKPVTNEAAYGGIANMIGYVCLALPTVYRVGVLSIRGTRSWNETQGSDLSGAAQLEILAGLLPLIGICLLLLSQRTEYRAVLPMRAYVFLGLWASSSLLIGTRDELIAPTVLLAWVYFARRGSISITKLTVIAVIGASLMIATGNWRSDGGGGGGNSPIGSAVRPLASGVNTTALVVQEVPDFSEYAMGSTYAAAVRYALPFTTVNTDDPNQMTAALRLPSLIGYTGGSGLGLSPVAEAYWNFGLWGAFLVPLLVGGFMAWSYARSSPWPHKLIHLLYPIMMARTPIAARSDFLQQYKGVFLVMLGVGLVLVVDRALSLGSGGAARRSKASAAGNT